MRAAVQDAVASMKVSRVSIEEGEDDTLRVFVHVPKSTTDLPKAVLLDIVNAASDAIAATGEERFPMVFGRFAATQEFAA